MIDIQTVQQASQAAGELVRDGGVLLPAGVGAGTALLLERLLEVGFKALAAKRNGGARASAGNVNVTVGGAGNGGGNGKGNGGQPMNPEERRMLSDHHRDLGRLEEKTEAIRDAFDRYHHENRQDHERIFRALEDLRKQ